jgi:predicted Zn-dependent peptidase
MTNCLRALPVALCVFSSIAISCVGARAEYKLVDKPAKHDPMAVHHYRLENGLNVYLTANHEEPRFYAEIAVRAGSKHDPAEATGMAHYLEHMLFKGTDELGTLDADAEKVHLDSISALYEQHWHSTDQEERTSIYALIQEQAQLAAQYAVPGEMDKVYSAMGASGLNAHTGTEETVYKVNLPANRLEQWARVEAERFSDPVFRLFQTELETVYEEKNRTIDNKDRLIRTAVNRQLWKVHPYGQRTTIGTVGHLKNPSLRRMYEYFHTWYVPNNMAVIISGDINIEQTIGLIDTHLGAWEAKELPDLPKWKEQKLVGAEPVEVVYPGEEYVLLAFRTEASSHKRTEALQLLDMILDNATAGLINLNLNQQQRVRRAGAWTTSHNNNNDLGAQYLYGIPKEGQTLEEVQALLLEQLEILKRGDFEEWLIPAIVTDFKKTYKRQLEGNGSRVGMLRGAFLSFEKWDEARGTLDRMAKVKKKDIVKLAKRYFGDNYVVGYRRDGEQELPSIEKPALEPIEMDRSRQSPFAADILAMPFEAIEPAYVIPGRDYTTRQVRDGVELYHTANPVNDLFSLQIVIDVGHRQDNRLPMGRDLMDKSGTQRFSSEELKKQWYRLGSELSIAVDDDESTFTLSGLDENFDASLALMMEALSQPTAGDSTMAELVQITIANRADATKDHRAIQRAMYRYARQGEASYYLNVPTNTELGELTAEQLHGLVSGLLGNRMRLEYTGSLSAEETLEKLAVHFQADAGDLREPPTFSPIPIRTPESTEILLFNKEMAQALVRIESGDVPYSEAFRPQVDLFNEYFYGGMAGIVFQELREARALAYSAWAWYFTGGRENAPNLMVGSIGCQADKTTEALGAFLGLIDNMPKSTDRFAEALEAQINSLRTSRLGFRQLLGAVRMWERQGVTIDPRSWRFSQIQQAELADVLEFHGDHIAGRPKMVTVVGDRSKMDLPGLEKYGVVREVGVEEIFGY